MLSPRRYPLVLASIHMSAFALNMALSVMLDPIYRRSQS